MDTEFIMLKAQVEAFRNYFMGLLPTIFQNDRERDSKVWLAKYLLWESERQNLSPYDFSDTLPLPEKDKISRRRHQLQVLMDVAYIQGQLEEYGILRKVDSCAAAQAEQVYARSNHSEASMIQMIDAL